MYYSSIGVIALIVHVIINYDLMKRVSRVGTRSVMQKRYRRFLIALIAYYLTDIIWGTLYENGNMLLTYIDTVAVFVTMTLSVLLWTRALIVFIDDKSKFGKIVLGGGWTIFLTEIIILVDLGREFPEEIFSVLEVRTLEDSCELVAADTEYG